MDRFLALPAGKGTLEAFAAGAGRRAEPPLAQFERAILQCTRIHPGRALQAVEKLLADGRRGRTGRQRAVLARLHAHALRAVGRARDALPRYAEASRRFVALGDRLEAGRTAIGWVDALAHTGRVAEALRVGARARRLLPARERATRARLEANLGNALYLSGRVSDAARQFRRARTRLSALQLTRDAALCDFNLGYALLLQGRAAAARASFQQARRAFERRGFAAQALQARAGTAAADLAQGRWSDALANLDGVAEALEAVGDERGVASVRREVASFLAALGATDAAEALAGDALARYRRLGLTTDAAHTAFLHARLLAAQGRTGDARVRLRAARRRFQAVGHAHGVLRCDLELGAAALCRGDPRAALGDIRRALAKLRGRAAAPDRARARALQAQALLAVGRAARAAAQAAAAHRMARGTAGRLERPWMALLAARSYDTAGQRRLALRWARRAASDAELVMRRLGTRALRDAAGDARTQLVREAVGIVLRRGGRGAARTALDLLARARSPRLLEDLLAGQEPVRDAQLRFAIARLRDELLRDVPGGQADVRFQALQRQAEHLEARLADATLGAVPPALRAARDRSLHRWAPRFTHRELVVYEQVGEHWGAFVVRARRVRWVPLPEAGRALDDNWTSLRLLLEAAAQAPPARRARLLADTLVEAQSDLGRLAGALWSPLGLRGRQVVVVPAGALQAVPLESLAAVAPGRGGGGSPPVVARLPHPAAAPMRVPSPVRDALLLHGPHAGARRELAAVRAALRRNQFRVRVAARRAVLRRQRDPLALLHVAAHGVFRREHWLMSGVQLQDGWLGFEELRRSWAKGALLTFGSCESGLSTDAPHGQLDGWLAAGLGAGARELVLTLWKLDDEAATAFARAFYPLWAGGLTAPQAAAAAREALRGQLPHPYSWAPFIAVG